MIKILIGLVAAIVIATGGFFGFEFYVQHRVAGEVEAAFEVNRRTQERDDWDAYADLFTEDAVYVEHELGTFEGREAIRAWLVPVMGTFEVKDGKIVFTQ